MDHLNKIKNYCAKREVCISEVTKKLLKIGLDKEETQKIVELLIKQKYIDEKRYAFAYVNDHYKLKKWGRNKIKNSLKLKGIASQDINLSLKEINQTIYFNNLQDILLQKFKNIQKIEKYSIKEKKGKLYNYLVSRGYEPSLVLKEITLIKNL
ncbi:MAG: regulatory protein RecX [Crocinitomicaceae bacterium]|nr:regulatory protein RecX [Crocinitomicaceae bacterium]